MSFRRELKKILAITECFVCQPRLSFRLLGKFSYIIHGFNYSKNYESVAAEDTAPVVPENETKALPANPLKTFFDSREIGRGIWKWEHYFDIYHHHFRKFVDTDVHVLEIGVYSGGSLEMWRHYFGARCHIYGVDIQEACKCYENEHTKIFIGDQENRNFWKSFKEQIPFIDILIDDGGHKTDQQIVTFEEMFPYIRPGGIYLCEDLHGLHNGFTTYMHGIVKNLNAQAFDKSQPRSGPSALQTWISSVHFYPYVTVIQKAERPVKQFKSLRHGTEWEPFPCHKSKKG